MSLPIFNTPDRSFSMMQTQWKSQLEPVISFPANNGLLLTGITVSSGVNTINHKLAKAMQGWIVTDINNNITLYRSAAFNDKTLTLTCSGSATLNLWVF